jgi:hypothetical protein
LTAVGANIQATTRRPFRGTVASFNEAGLKAKSFHATIDWGDSSGPAAGRIKGARGHFVVSGNHHFGSAGTFQLTVTITDTAGHQATVMGTEVVAAAGTGMRR